MTSVFYVAYFIFHFGGTQPLEVRGDRFDSYELCMDSSKSSAKDMKLEDPRNFLGEINVECRSSGSVWGKVPPKKRR